ncbi:MAG TPA: XdhC/CoxI family protein [Pyrinomonadaceae bacterium]
MSAAGDPPPNEKITRALTRVLRDGALAVLVTIVEAPRGVGAKILAEESGALVGTTGDASLDAALRAQARVFLDSRAEARTLPVEEFAPALEEWRGARVLFERLEPEPRVVVCGAGHVGAALARLAHAVGYRVTLIDDREDFVARSRFPEEGIELVAASDWTRPVREAIGTGRGVYAAVVTRGHSEDEECMRAVLAARPRYVGMIGSRRRTNIVLERLREAGLPEELLREVRAPVGLDIGAVSPEEVALSILAEIVAHRRGGTGESLSAWRRK